MYVFMENWRNLMEISIRKPRGTGDTEVLQNRGLECIY